MIESKSYNLQSGIFSEPQLLTMTAEYVEFQRKNSSVNDRIEKIQINGFKYINEPIYWYRFVVGRKYSILIKDTAGKVIMVKFRNYFNARREYGDHYLEILKIIREYYLRDLINDYVGKFWTGDAIELGRLRINRDGISVIGTGLDFKWTNLRIDLNERGLDLFRKDAPEYRMAISVYHDWYADILSGIIVSIATKMNQTLQTF